MKTKPGTIVIEDLSLKNMHKNHKLAQALLDSCLSGLRQRLIYKCAWSSILLYQVPHFFASSKICSRCGNKKEELSLSERTYKCERCDLTIDRDYNAAINIKNYYINLNTVGSTGINAHGQNVRREKQGAQPQSGRSAKSTEIDW